MKAEECKGFWVSADVSEETLDVSVAQMDTPLTERKTLPVLHVEKTPVGLRNMVTWVRHCLTDKGRVLGICVESTGRLSRRLADELGKVEPSWPAVSIVNPKRVVDFGRSLGLRDKTDRIDATVLALFGVTFRPRPTPAPPTIYGQLRELARAYDSLLTHKQSLDNNRRDNTDEFVCQCLRECSESLATEIAELEKRARQLVKKDPPMKRDMALLDSIRGIGFKTAWVLVAELGDLRTYSRKQLVASVGMYPRQFRSGKSVEKRPRLAKGAHPLVRKFLYNAARSIYQSQHNTLKDYLVRREKEGRTSMQCIVGIMRKLLLIARAVLIQGKKYDPRYGQVR